MIIFITFFVSTFTERDQSEWVGFRGHRFMRHSPSEKLEIIRIVEDSELSVPDPERDGNPS